MTLAWGSIDETFKRRRKKRDISDETFNRNQSKKIIYPGLVGPEKTKLKQILEKKLT
jgi:hypothetical protein